jgi:hypothetical protein
VLTFAYLNDELRAVAHRCASADRTEPLQACTAGAQSLFFLPKGLI